MKCVVLAAGYATRLYPLTENFPKPLLEIGGRTILDWLLGDIETSGRIDEYIVISNGRFAPHFEKWAKLSPLNIRVVNDGTFTNETRLGAVKDIVFAVDALGIDDDLLVIAGDNVLNFSLKKFIDYALSKGASCAMRYYESDTARLRKSGVSEIGENDRLLSLEEKPSEPKSNWCTPPFYYYTAADVKKIPAAIEQGCGTDAPGSLVGWMCKNSVMYSMEMPGSRFDIGNLESYEKAKKEYKGITRA